MGGQGHGWAGLWASRAIGGQGHGQAGGGRRSGVCTFPFSGSGPTQWRLYVTSVRYNLESHKNVCSAHYICALLLRYTLHFVKVHKTGPYVTKSYSPRTNSFDERRVCTIQMLRVSNATIVAICTLHFGFA